MTNTWSMLLVVLTASLFRTATAQIAALEPTGPQPAMIDQSGRRIPFYTGSYALLVSEHNYLGSARNGWRPLEATTREMDAVATALRRHGFRVSRANDLTGEQLNTVFREFMAENGYDSNNRLLFFFSGHGYTNPQNEMGYLVPIDALDPNISPAGFYSKAIPIEQIQTWARELTARHVLFLFDSCFSGSIFLSRGGATVPDARGSTLSERLAFFQGSSAKPVRQFIAAGGPKEELPATSIFVPLLLEGLDGRASSRNDGYVTGKELGMWIEQTLPKYRSTQSPHSDVIKQPNLSFGDMVFQVPAPSVASGGPAPVVTDRSATAPQAQVSPPGPDIVATARSSVFPAVPRAVEKVTLAADVFMDFDKSVLKPEDVRKLDDLVAKIGGMNLEVVIAVGRADVNEGNDFAYRLRLSERRAEAVKAFLVSRGIERNRVYTEGKGDRDAPGTSTPEGRAKKRRVEIEVVGTRPTLQ